MKLKKSSFAIAASLAVMLVMAACVRDAPAVPPAPSATETQAPAPTQTPLQSAQPTLEAQPSPPGTQIPAAPTPEPPSNIAPPFEMNGNGHPAANGLAFRPGTQEFTTVEVVKLLTPSVAQITTRTVSVDLFNQPVPSTGVGTGVILDANGHILTNYHVVEGAQEITVTVDDGESFSARVVGGDEQTDLAVIKIDAEGLHPATLGDSLTLQVGEDVIAIGEALGLAGGPTVTKGVVSALGRTIDINPTTTIVDLIQTDAEINPGNSGGPLVNSRAEVVGINTAIIQPGRGISFAINVNDAKEVSRQLIEKGFVQRGYLGILPVNLTPSIAARFGINATEGALVGQIIPGTSAAVTGLRDGDVIVELGGQKITNTGELSKFLMEHLPGETVEMVFIRRGTRITTQVTLGEKVR